MKVYIYPAYKEVNCTWCCLLRDEKNRLKVIKGKEWGKGYYGLQLKAISEGIKLIKYPVDLFIYTHLKLIQVVINENLLSVWKNNNWYENGSLVDFYSIWERYI